MKIKRISILFLSCLLLVFSSFGSYAAVRSDSNAFMALSLNDDSGIALYSSLGTVTNTLSSSTVPIRLDLKNASTGVSYQAFRDATLSNGRYSFSFTAPDGYYLTRLNVLLTTSHLPASGGYLLSFDYASDFSYDYTSGRLWFDKSYSNAQKESGMLNLGSNFDQFSGDIYISPYEFNLTNVDQLIIYFNTNVSDQISQIGGSFAVHFERASVSSSAPSTGTDTSSQDYQVGVSNSLNIISNSLEELIQHISNQLAALWDQMYNLMHVPTMAKLDEILSSLRAIANNSDIYAVVEEIDSSSKEQTSQIVQNANENTSKVEQAVEKHGNFIIEGLKGLFIPSDEYFKSYFDDLYTFFSDRFGFLSFPIDLLQRLADLFLNSDDVDCVLTLPSFEISGEQLLTEQSFNLTEFLETNFSILLSALRIVGDCIIIGAFVNLCSKKWDEVMKN